MSKPDFFEPTINEDLSALSGCIKKDSVDKVDEVGMSALHWSALFGKEKSVAFLLSNNANTELRDNDGIRAYDWAKNQANKKTAQMIKLKMQADQMGWPILNWIAKEGQYNIISAFINQLNINLVDKDFGRSSLHWAVYSAKVHKNIKTLEKILESECVYVDLKDQSDERTAVCMAAYLNDVEALRFLLASNPDLDIKDKNPGYSPIMWSIDRKNQKIVKILIAAGASISLSNNDGDDILKMAEKSKLAEIIDIIGYCAQFDRSIKKYVDMLFMVKNRETNAIEDWHQALKQSPDNEFYKLPAIIQPYFNKAFSRIIKGPSLYSHNIFDKDRKMQSLTKPLKQTLPSEFLSNEEILIKRLKSKLNRLF
jgi:ankyrin repeat protein